MVKYQKGYDFLEVGADYKEFAIDVIHKDIPDKLISDTHYSQIVIFGNEDLRDKILKLLQDENEESKD